MKFEMIKKLKPLFLILSLSLLLSNAGLSQQINSQHENYTFAMIVRAYVGQPKPKDPKIKDAHKYLARYSRQTLKALLYHLRKKFPSDEEQTRYCCTLTMIYFRFDYIKNIKRLLAEVDGEPDCMAGDLGNVYDEDKNPDLLLLMLTFPSTGAISEGLTAVNAGTLMNFTKPVLTLLSKHKKALQGMVEALCFTVFTRKELKEKLLEIEKRSRKWPKLLPTARRLTRECLKNYNKLKSTYIFSSTIVRI